MTAVKVYLSIAGEDLSSLIIDSDHVYGEFIPS